MTIHRYTVQLREPEIENFSSLSRPLKRRALVDSSQEARDRLLSWLEQRRLGDQVVRVGDPTMFRTLFLDATETVGKALREHPEVLEVSEGGKVSFSLAEEGAR